MSPYKDPDKPDTETVAKALRMNKAKDRKGITGWLVALGAVGGLAWKLIAGSVDVSRLPDKLQGEIDTRQMHETGMQQRLTAIETSLKDMKETEDQQHQEERQQLDRIETQLRITRSPKDKDPTQP